MISLEQGVLEQSEYYIYTASSQAKQLFFYPLCTGHFYYSSSYYLDRKTYDSFLLMYIIKGKCIIETDDSSYTASEGQIVFLDCYRPHKYYTETGWEAVWLHFDGPLAREYYNLVTNRSNIILSLKDNYIFFKYLNKVHNIFKDNSSVKEALVNQYITTMLTELIISKENLSNHPAVSDIIEDTTAYINEHICDDLTLDQLASKASLSPYYFTRLFKKETGFTPHEYIIASRINHARFLLKNTNISIKEICFSCGFASESSFCSTFKKWENVTPGTYRLSVKQF